ncbi:MAG: hypothetical protein QF886_04920 [Planctomycetota bacterium]|nr:hypothetical protein [Planctomycetota bacterium]
MANTEVQPKLGAQKKSGSGSSQSRGIAAVGALRLLEQLELMREQGSSDVQKYLQLLSRTAMDPNVDISVRRGATLIRDLIDVRAKERRHLGQMADAINQLIKTSKESDGSWAQADSEIKEAAKSAEDQQTGDILENLRQGIQRFIDSYLNTVLQTLHQPLKSSELSSLLGHYLSSGEEEKETAAKSSLESEVLVEILQQKYGNILLLIKQIIGSGAMSRSSRVLLNTFEEINEEFPSFQEEEAGKEHLLSTTQDDPYLGNDLKNAVEQVESLDWKTGIHTKITSEAPEESSGTIEAVSATGELPPLLAMSKNIYKTRAAKILDIEAGSLAPGERDLLDDNLDYIHRIWKESLTWEPHPNYEQLRYFRDHVVRLLTTGHTMELLFRSYREVHRYEASDIYSLDTQKLLAIPSVKEIVCLLLYPKLARIPGLNARAFESLLGKQYSVLMKCCREISGMDVFLHDEWPESLDSFLEKFNATYLTLREEEQSAIHKFLKIIRRPW